MKSLILDFLRRWWWAVAIVALVAAGTTFRNFAVVFAPIGSLLLMFDAQRGAIRATRSLPLTSREQALAWWCVGVIVVPLICAVAMIPAAALHEWFFPKALGAWFSSGVQLYVGLGYSALCFLIGIAMPLRPAEGWWEQLWQMFIGALWGLSVPGTVFLLPNLPKTPAQVQPWHWFLFGLVPLLVPLSYYSAGEMLKRRPVPPFAGVKAPKAAERRATGGMQGIPLFLVTVPGRMAVMLVALTVMQATILRVLTPHGSGQAGSMVGLQSAIFGCLIGALSSEWIGLRALRPLPFSTEKLTLLLLSAPLTAGIVCGLLNVSALGFAAPGASPLEIGLGVAGLSALLLAINLHLPGAGKFAVMFAAAMAVPLTGFLLPKAAGWFAGTGILAGVAAFVVIRRGLWRSRAFYETRRMGAAFGQAQQ